MIDLVKILIKKYTDIFLSEPDVNKKEAARRVELFFEKNTGNEEDISIEL